MPYIPPCLLSPLTHNPPSPTAAQHLESPIPSHPQPLVPTALYPYSTHSLSPPLSPIAHILSPHNLPSPIAHPRCLLSLPSSPPLCCRSPVPPSPLLPGPTCPGGLPAARPPGAGGAARGGTALSAVPWPSLQRRRREPGARAGPLLGARGRCGGGSARPGFLQCDGDAERAPALPRRRGLVGILGSHRAAPAEPQPLPCTSVPLSPPPLLLFSNCPISFFLPNPNHHCTPNKPHALAAMVFGTTQPTPLASTFLHCLVPEPFESLIDFQPYSLNELS